MSQCIVGLAVAALGVVDLCAAASQVITLDSGERLVGEVLPKSTQETLYIQSKLFGELSMPRARVQGIAPQVAKVAKAKAKPAPQKKKPAKPKQVAAASEPVEHTLGESQGLDPEEVLEEEIRFEKKLFDYLTGLSAPNTWSGNLRMGFNISSGDSKWTETYLRGKLEVRPEDSGSLYRYAGSYTYRENENANGEKFKTQDKYDASFLYRYTFENDWFLQNTASWRVDQKKGINRDLSDLVGAGYSFKPKPTIEYNLGGSAGIEDYDSSGLDSRNGQNPSLSVFHEFKWTPLKRTSVVHTYSYFWNPDKTSQYNYVVKTALRVRLTDLLGFEFSHNKDYDSDTGDGQDKDDTRWLNAMILFF